MKEATRTGARGPRLRVLAANCLIAAVATTGIAACGTTPAPTSSGTPVKPRISLTVTKLTKGQATKKWTLHCEPAGGTDPNAAAACRTLLSIKNPFADAPTGTNCPMILANGPSYVFDGTWDGSHVHKTILDGGCSIGVWNKLSKVMY
jgi:hypothetical protein